MSIKRETEDAVVIPSAVEQFFMPFYLLRIKDKVIKIRVFDDLNSKSAAQQQAGGDQEFWARILWLSVWIPTPKTSTFARKSSFSRKL